ncbi:hypothetical protein lerEdw1_013115 [Lerista edwardsae]|nr:hypothetical protein lerEdw1_013115 [Lerista edwardsae]
MESPDQPLESKSQRDIYNSISLHVECLQNTHQAIDSIIETVGEFNIKLAIKILADKMLTEPTTDRISTLLLGLAGRYFNNVMYMLQTHIRKDCPHPMVFRTLGNLASHYALKCIPFLSLTFVYIRVMLKLAMINDIKEDVCYAMENFATAINYYYKHWEECSFPREAESQLCSPMIPIYQHLVYHWLNDKELAVRTGMASPEARRSFAAGVRAGGLG